MNIAAFIWGAHPSSSYRAFHPMAELARRGNLVATYEVEEPAPSEDDLATIARAFAFSFFGPFEGQPGVAQIARRLSELGMPVVWDYDDDVVRPERRAGFDAMTQIVDVITTTNESLPESSPPRQIGRAAS